MEKNIKETGIKIDVETSGLDAALEKANRLVKVLKEASELIDSLSKKLLKT